MSWDAAIIGLGYVGLPLAHAATLAGRKILGFDVNRKLVRALNEGRSHVDDVDDRDIERMISQGFEATSDPDRLSEASVVVICVPTPLSDEGGPDLRAVSSAVHTVAERLKPGMTVILESTTYPGTTEEIVRPIIEATGLRVGEKVHLAFSPERIDPGRQDFGAGNTPKVVGGCTPICTERAAAFYAGFIETIVPVKGTQEAEMSKLLENTYRHVNIALVNEMAILCHDLDIDMWEAIRAAATKPFGFQAFYPGPGVGGHCIPIDPNYLSHRVRAKLKHSFRFVELAQDINASMPQYVVSRVSELLNEHTKPLRGSTILLLGVTYKANIADQRESPALEVARHLIARGSKVEFHDPHVETWVVHGASLPRVTELDEALARADLTILLQAHHAYDLQTLASRTSLFFDTRGQAGDANNIVRL